MPVIKFGEESPVNYNALLTFSQALAKKLTIMILSSFCVIEGIAGGGLTEKDKNQFKPRLTFSGFIKHDIFYDTRQTVNAREALVTLYPQNVHWDKDQNDINSRPSFNMLNIHSRLRCEITGPAVLGAETRALVESDFYGNENKNFSDLNGLRLFNAYIRFKWNTTELQVGQDWHPLSIQSFFPATVSFSAGAPFHPMSRNPQVRITQTAGNLKVAVSFLTQRDFTGTGPDGPGSQYLRNSGLPNVHLQAVYGGDSSIISAGVGVDYKKIVPELFTTNEYGEVFRTSSTLEGLSSTGFLAVKTKPLTLKLQGVYTQNAYDQLMIGGYAISNIADKRTLRKEFANLNTVSFWADAQSGLPGRMNFGLFYGYTRNLGSFKCIDGALYARGADIKSLFRVAPRVVYTYHNVGISLEGEYTGALYGTANGDGNGRVTNTHAVANFRSLMSVRYSF